jgi:GGDEF domain-containing protein
MTCICNDDSANSVMGRADEAMYRVKNNTKNGFFFIDSPTAAVDSSS